MEQYVIKGGNPLVGEVEIGGAKNAALAILSAAVMTDETVTIENLPNVRDINVLLNAIQEIGAKVDRIDAHTVKINGSFIRDFNVDNEFIRKIRASYYLIGALLGKYKRAEVALPGGCNIGGRPIDLHIRALQQMGVEFREEEGLLSAQVCSIKAGLVARNIAVAGKSVDQRSCKIRLPCLLAKGITIYDFLDSLFP